MTCGEETEEECLQAVEPWLDKVAFCEVRHVYPQVVALNRMIELVQTEFFIPLDADIVLNPDASERIFKACFDHQHNDQWHSILFPLWDTLTEQRILALKLLRTKIMKAHPFVESATPDVEHYQRLTQEGYTCVHEYLKEEPIGQHIVRGHHFCYHKYRDVYLTLRSHGWVWDQGVFKGGTTVEQCAKNHFDYFMYKLITTENKDYLSCIAGMVDGLLSPVENRSKSLKREDAKVAPKQAIHEFMEWYLEVRTRWTSVP